MTLSPIKSPWGVQEGGGVLGQKDAAQDGALGCAECCFSFTSVWISTASFRGGWCL